MIKFMTIICCFIFMILLMATGQAPAQSEGLEIENLSPPHQNTPQVQTIIARIKQKYCPDRRVSVFDITSKIDGDKIVLTGEVLDPAAKDELLTKMKAVRGYTIEDKIVVLPDAASQKTPFGVVRISVAQLRREPSVTSEMISQAIMGGEIRVLKAGNGGFYYCQMEDKYLGWLKSSSMAMGDKDFLQQWREKDKLVVTALFAQAWESRKVDALPISDLVMLNTIILLRSYPDWYEVELPDGRKGFVNANQVAEEKAFARNNPPTAEAIIKTGKRMIGNPYVWGGTSVKGFDCSGFTQTVYKHHGIQLPRDANMQVKMGREVSMENDLQDLRPANLLFFGSSISRISHVGMYLGEGRYIHCSGLMRVNSFDPKADDYDAYLRGRLQTVRRILD